MSTINTGTTVNHEVTISSSGSYTSPLTVAAGAGVSNASGVAVYSALLNATLINQGLVKAVTSYDFAVQLKDGGSVTNSGTGLIQGYYGVDIAGTAGTVTNSATIFGTAGFGVELGQGGSVNNSGLIKAVGGLGVFIVGTTGTVTNTGTILNTLGGGIQLSQGGTVTNTGTGLIQGYTGILISNVAGTVTNSGTIIGTGSISGAAINFSGASGSNLLVLENGYKLVGKVIGSPSAGVTNTLELAGSISAPLTVNYGSLTLSNFQDVLFGTGGNDTLKLSNAVGAFADTISNFTSASDTIDLTAVGTDGHITGQSSTTLTVTGSGGSLTLKLDGSDATSFAVASDGGTGVDITACYCSGTRILTPHGEVPVEDLKIGDEVVTRAGEAKALKWIGRRSYVGWLAAGNPKALPICFKPGSLADGIPRRELWVSPEHAMYLEGALVPAELLVNGSSIVKAEAVEEVHYFHLELAAHDVILAEGAWAESFVDDDSRGIFHNAAEYRTLYPEAPIGIEARYCAPRLEEGFELAALRRKLAGRARRLLPDGTATPAVLHGNLEVVTHGRISGWVRDPEAPDAAVSVVVLANGAEIGRIIANRYRGDLKKAGIGDGCHAFELIVPDGLAAAQTHKIEVCRADDGTKLPGSPRVLAAPTGQPERTAVRSAVAGAPLGLLRGNLDHVDRWKILGWAQDGADGNRAVGLVVMVNGERIGRVLANRYRKDLEAAGIGSGHHGFELVLLNPLSPTAAHQVRVTREADGAELPGSPLTLAMPTHLDEAAEGAFAETLAGVSAEDEERALAMLTRETDRLLARRAERQGGRAEREALMLFRRRWGGAQEEYEREAGGLRALIVDTQVPDAAHDAGSVAILSHIRALQGLGYAVSFAPGEAMHSNAALERLAAAEGVTVCAAPFYSCVEDVLARRAKTFDLVYLHRAAVADRYLSLVRRYCPKARVIYSVADLHHLRVARQAEIEQRPELLAYSRHLAAIELAAASRADIVVTHSPVEAELLRRAIGPSKVHVVPFAVPQRSPRKPLGERHGLAFLGSSGHAPNGDAVHHLIRDVLPLVWDVDAAITCKIVGHGWDAGRLPTFDPRIEVVGAVEDLDEVFDSVRLTVAPLRFGAGIKGKVLDSFAARLPCVMTPIAAEGLPLSGALAQLVGVDPAALAKAILRLHRDMAANTRLAAAGTRLLARQFSPEHVTAALAAVLSNRPPETITQSPKAQRAVA